MDAPCAAYQEVSSGGEALAGAGRLLIVVPPRLPPRVSFARMLAGSGIDIIVDRRHAVRRRTSSLLPNDRRRQDRRGRHHLFGYLYGCRIVRMGLPPSS